MSLVGSALITVRSAMKPGAIRPSLAESPKRSAGAVVKTRVLRIAGLGESDVEQIVAPIYKTFQNPRTTILSAPGQVELHLVAEAKSDAEAEARIEALAAPIREALAGRVYSEDGRDLVQVVAQLLESNRHTIALAESCTGGLLAARLTEVPGSSAYLGRAFVTYANDAKTELLGVPAVLIAERGAVSEEVARAMAEGAMRSARSSIGVGITGIAGPDGGTPEKPVGLVYIGIAGAAGDRVRRAQFPGERDRIRFQATQSALEMIRRGLLGLAPLA
jgi:nicotinamide-nucleotide amidase